MRMATTGAGKKKRRKGSTTSMQEDKASESVLLKVSVPIAVAMFIFDVTIIQIISKIIYSRVQTSS